jgi:kumamolisin
VNSESQLAGSYRQAPLGEIVDDVNPDQSIALTVYLQNPDYRLEERIDCGSVPRSIVTARYRAAFSASAAIFESFAARHGLSIHPRPELRCIHVKGTAGTLSSLFGTCLYMHHDGHRRFRARSGFLAVPKEIAGWTHSVLGFDERPVLRRPLRSFASTTSGLGMWPTEIAKLYGIPTTADAKGECIGIIAVGGSYTDGDLAAASKKAGRPKPLVVCYNPQNALSDPDANRELALDLQIIAGLAPSARIVVYYTSNTEKGFGDIVNTVLADGTNSPHVVSISWGGIEGLDFSEAGCRAIDQIFQTAGDFGVTVVAAAGDKLATSGQVDHFAHVQFPASSPSVLACGGTSFLFGLDNATIADETVWHDQASGTGGGISDFFGLPNYQRSASLPPSVNGGRVGRGIPDVAAAASKSPGYRIVVGGETVVEDGTSAATPLWASLIAIANAKRGTPLGSVHKYLYQNSQLIKTITKGDNRVDGIGYDAGRGWNACTGLGVPKGVDTINGLAQMPLTEN